MTFARGLLYIYQNIQLKIKLQLLKINFFKIVYFKKNMRYDLFDYRLSKKIRLNGVN